MSHRTELPDIVRVGALIGNPVRAQLIGTLMDGGEHSATELAARAGASAQAASAHLARLVQGGLLMVRPQGRHRYYRLRNEQVAAAIEVLSVAATVTASRPAEADAELRRARRCYDHVAGRVGVAICDFAIARCHVVAGGESLLLTDSGARWLASMEIEPPAGLRRPLVRLCQDWTERRQHLAGWVGAALCRRLQEMDALRRLSGTRALTITPKGRSVLAQLFGVDLRHTDPS